MSSWFNLASCLVGWKQIKPTAHTNIEKRYMNDMSIHRWCQSLNLGINHLSRASFNPKCSWQMFVFELFLNSVCKLNSLVCLSVCISPQVAVAQFSDDARTEFQLSSHSNKEALLEAIQRIRYKGGNTKTGQNSEIQWNTIGEQHFHLKPIRWGRSCGALQTPEPLHSENVKAWDRLNNPIITFPSVLSQQVHVHESKPSLCVHVTVRVQLAVQTWTQLRSGPWLSCTSEHFG